MSETLVQLGFGEIVSWKSPKECDYSLVMSSLTNNGLDASVARALLPRNAFIRGVRSMEDKRIIRKLKENPDSIVFQLNLIKKDPNGVGFEYPHETEIELEKDSGHINCSDQVLRAKVQTLLNLEMDRRTSGDITKIVQTLFQKAGGDLIPIREQGGAYFVPANMKDLVDKIRNFLGDIGGEVRRFGGLNGEDTRESLAGAIGSHFESMIAEFRGTIETLSADSSEPVRERRAKTLSDLRTRLSSYRDLLKLSADEIDAQLEEAEREMFARLNETIAEPAIDAETAAMLAALDGVV